MIPIVAMLADKMLPQVPPALGGEAPCWIVVFVDPPGPRRWWHRFVKPGFRHCLALGFDGRCWLQVDCLSNLIDVRSFAEAEITVVMRLLASQDAHALALERTVVSRGIFQGPLYCVSSVKHLLGVSSWAATPWQLYLALKRRGAREVDLGEW